MSGKFNEISDPEFSNEFESPEIKQEDVEDIKLGFNEISDGTNELTETPEVVETTETVERRDGSVSEIKYEDGEKITETRTYPDGNVREVDYKPEIGTKSVVITKVDGSRKETTHWGERDLTTENFAPDGNKTSTYERLGDLRIDTQYDQKGVILRKTEISDDHKTQTRFDKNGEPYATIQDGKKELKPNHHYELRDGSAYDTDDKGRVISAEKEITSVKSVEESRDNITDKIDGERSTDERGHLIADRFGGENGFENLAAQDKGLNRGEMKTLENKVAKAFEDGSDVTLKVAPKYEGDDKRPTSYEVTITIDGKSEVHTLDNRSPDEQVA